MAGSVYGDEVDVSVAFTRVSSVLIIILRVASSILTKSKLMARPLVSRLMGS